MVAIHGPQKIHNLHSAGPAAAASRKLEAPTSQVFSRGLDVLRSMHTRKNAHRQEKTSREKKIWGEGGGVGVGFEVEVGVGAGARVGVGVVVAVGVGAGAGAGVRGGAGVRWGDWQIPEIHRF